MQISEIGEVISGGTPSTIIDEYWGDEVVWITPSDLSKIKGRSISTSSKKLTNLGLGKSSMLIPKKSVVMSCRAPIGYFAIPEVDFVTNQGCKSIVFFAGQNPEFHYYNFLLNVEKFKQRGEGTTFAEISKKEVEKLTFNVLPLSQQKKIAEILTTCDEVIAQTEAAITKYKAIKQGMMQDLFTRGIDPHTHRLRPTPQQAPELYQESELGLIPKEWEVKTFGEFVTDNLYGPRFSANDYHANGNVRTIRGTDFTKEGNILYQQAPIALLQVSKVQPHILRNGDLVMITTADCGLTAVFEEQDMDYIPSAYSVKYRFNESIDSYFVKYLMQTEPLTKQVNKFVRQGTLGNLPGSDVLRFLFSKPKLNEQIEIVERINSLFKKIEIEESALEKYQKVKIGLMQDLLTGKVAVGG